ncbi:glycosyltransferase [Methylomonas sp. MED-D]|uniref:glycosyltransferase n=1 Tax=unclassified Methylomonas TaxID=2608980 RepID=UPI0028A39DA3|nr:glycosyltransferase [Methylomonas sp. MV1]MDT4328973.1 glycosyltransferase [Methylomonas sp. MV1]
MSEPLAERPPRRWILHDYMQVNGGAERLVLTMAKGLPGFGLAVSALYSDYTESADTSDVDIRVLSRETRWPRIARALWTFARRLPMVRQAELVIYSGIYAPLAVRSQRAGRRVYYCHTPPRFAFDRKDEYLQRAPSVLRWVASLLIYLYRQAYLQSVARMDLILTNSAHVQRRIYRQTGLKAEILYPPINVDAFRWQSAGDYFLSLGRLEPNKRVERVVRAFMGLPGQRLVVASGGSQLAYLQRLAEGADNIHFTGWLSEAGLIELIGNARACIYIPLDEDFGMSAVEAMAAGKPVIGVAEGGMLETIVDNESGFLLPADPSPGQIADAVVAMSRERAASMRAACETRAAGFSEEKFLERLCSLLDNGA